jgi:hypothetical protein
MISVSAVHNALEYGAQLQTRQNSGIGAVPVLTTPEGVGTEAIALNQATECDRSLKTDNISFTSSTVHGG